MPPPIPSLDNESWLASCERLSDNLAIAIDSNLRCPEVMRKMILSTMAAHLGLLRWWAERNSGVS